MGMTAELDREGEEALDESHNALREVLEMLVDRDALRIAHLEAQKERVFSPLQDELLTINQWDKDGRMRQSEELLGDRMTTLEQEILKFNGALDALWAQHGAMTQEIGTLRSLAVPNNSVPKPKVPSRPTEEQQEKIWMSGSLEEKEALLVMLTSARQDLAQEKEQEAEPDIWQEYHEQLGILMESTKRKLAELDKTDERDQKEQRKKLLSLLENL